MNFQFELISIWLNNGKRRDLKFSPNKINMITGESSTGKTAILDIIDYCLLASKHKISEDMINENAAWYGIKFFVGEKSYSICRKAPKANTVSADYYFSSVGEMPTEFPEANISDSAIKRTLGVEFALDENTKVAYGGNSLKANSKLSLRYFLLFNTISQDIITHSEEFFDKQKDNRYREALPRTFDLAVGIDTVENILKREKRDELEKELRRIERQQTKYTSKQADFVSQLAQIIRTAKEFGLIEASLDIEASILALKAVIASHSADEKSEVSDRYDVLTGEINSISRRIKNLQKFGVEYQKYKSNLSDTHDSLKPISFLNENYPDLIKTSIFNELFESSEHELKVIKRSIAKETPLDSDVQETVRMLETERTKKRQERATLPKDEKSFETEKEKYIFIGQTKAQIDLYESNEKETVKDFSARINKIEELLEDLIIESVENNRDLFGKVLDETIQEYISSVSAALVNYGTYKSAFNYKDKKLQLRKPKTAAIDNVGSSSNHMFLHLFLFLGIHEIILQRKVPHVPSFLVIDQFSRPYWGDEKQKKSEIDHGDLFKVESALRLLDNFLKQANDNGDEFQMIIFEHIPPSYWEGFSHFHLVEEFIDGNALIPPDLLD